MSENEILELAETAAPELLKEFLRLRKWASVCLGDDVAKWEGAEV